MIRTCPRCRDFYADGSLLFCPADGMPLADLDPHDDTLAEAARVVEEKERVLRRQTRRLTRRRVMTVTTSVLITTLVVFIIVLNTYVYYRAPEPDAPESGTPVVAAVLTPTPTSTPRRSETPVPTPTADSPSTPFVPAFTPTPTPEASSTPGRIRNPVSPATPDDTSTPTPTPITDATPVVTETPTVTQTPAVKETPTPSPPTPTPTQTPTRRQEPGTPDTSRPSRPTDESTPIPDPIPISYPAPTPASAPRCEGSDRKRLKRELVARFAGAWMSAIMEDRSAAARQYAPRGAERPQAELASPITYEVEFSESCEPVFVRAKYKWRISWHGGPAFSSCSKRKDGQKTFTCRKDEAEWRCG